MKSPVLVVINAKTCVEMHNNKCNGNSSHIPPYEMRRVFCKNSLENTPESCYSDPTWAIVFKECMMDTLAGDESQPVHCIVKIMKRVKEK